MMSKRYFQSTKLQELAGVLFLGCAMLVTRQTVAQQGDERGLRPPTFAMSDGKDMPPPESFRLDELLMKSLENHPEIITAKAKVALAEAELNTKRFEVAREIMPLYEKWQSIHKNLQRQKAHYEGLARNAAKATTDLADAKIKKNASELDALRMNAEVWMANAQQELEKLQRIEAELSRVEQSIRQFSSLPAARVFSVSTTNSAIPKRPPEGPVVDKIKTALDKQVSVDFNETPLGDIRAYLADSEGFPFICSAAALVKANIDPTKIPLTIRLAVPLRALLQAIEDAQPELQFVVRDYGIMLTTREDAQARGFTPAVDFARPSDTATVKTFLRDETAQPVKRLPGGDGVKTFSPSDKQADPFGGKPGAKAPPADNPAPNSQSDDPFGG